MFLCASADSSTGITTTILRIMISSNIMSQTPRHMTCRTSNEIFLGNYEIFWKGPWRQPFSRTIKSSILENHKNKQIHCEKCIEPTFSCRFPCSHRIDYYYVIESFCTELVHERDVIKKLILLIFDQ